MEEDDIDPERDLFPALGRQESQTSYSKGGIPERGWFGRIFRKSTAGGDEHSAHKGSIKGE